jgi:hypothetical protein
MPFAILVSVWIYWPSKLDDVQAVI